MTTSSRSVTAIIVEWGLAENILFRAGVLEPGVIEAVSHEKMSPINEMAATHWALLPFLLSHGETNQCGSSRI